MPRRFLDFFFFPVGFPLPLSDCAGGETNFVDRDVCINRLVPSPSAAAIKHLNPFRRTLPGRSSVGVSVLSVPGQLVDPDASLIDLRFDSGADLSLISEGYYRSLPTPPPLKKGFKLKLLQLTSSETRVLGYVNTKIYLVNSQGQRISLDVEAYVVTGMTVPVLLGEDFHENYSLTVQRKLGYPTTIKIGSLPHLFTAVSTSRSLEARLVTRRKDKTRQRTSIGQVLRAKETVTIPAFSTKKVTVDGDLGTDKSWLVERSLVHLEGGSYLLVPSSLFESSNPVIPVSNPTHLPRILRKGELLANADSPEDILSADTPDARL
ncbi:hypothetical protein SISNIDRAFT_420118, partial [Sistotremastrum niveocremeum HHB9708]